MPTARDTVFHSRQIVRTFGSVIGAIPVRASRSARESGSSGARPLHERALAIRETALGPEHPDTATSLDNLASRSIAGPWIRSAFAMSGANRPGPGRARAIPLNPAGVQHGEIGRSHPVCDPIQLSRVLNLLQEPNIVFGQAVRSSALPQQCEVPERWVAVVFIALGNVGHGLQRRAAAVLGIQP